MSEEEALAVFENPHLTASICHSIAQTLRLTAFPRVRFRLVQHRATPLSDSMKLVHYLVWPELLRLSVDVQVLAQVRRAVDGQLLGRLRKLSPGEKIAAAKYCSSALIRELLFDPDPRVFAALLLNQRLREEELLTLAGSEKATAEKLRLLAADRKWSCRYAIRKTVAQHPLTPRAVAASQLRFLSAHDLSVMRDSPFTSTYLQRCIERMEERGDQRGAKSRLAD